MKGFRMRPPFGKVKLSKPFAYRRRDRYLRIRSQVALSQHYSTGPGSEQDRISVQQFQGFPIEMRSGEGTSLQVRKTYLAIVH